MTIQRQENLDLVLVYSDIRFKTGALLTQAAYTTFIKQSTEAHTADLISPEKAALLNLEFFNSLELH